MMVPALRPWSPGLAEHLKELFLHKRPQNDLRQILIAESSVSEQN